MKNSDFFQMTMLEKQCEVFKRHFYKYAVMWCWYGYTSKLWLIS